MTSSEWQNKLYYGDNLVGLRDKDHFPNESIDLIYLDPPFNSKTNYNVIFNEPGGEESQAQIQAFDDSWHWDRAASEGALRDLGGPGGKPELVELIHWIARREHTASRSMAAYLSMMAIRLVELYRVLKPTGSLYLHCDPTASHYLKVVMDAVFGPANFRNEVVWKRTTGHRDSHRWNHSHDVLLFYSRGSEFVWNSQYEAYDDEYVRKNFRNTDPDGRRFIPDNLLAAGVRHGESGKPWRGIDPTLSGHHWQYTIQKLEELDKAGRIYWPSKGRMPRIKRYLNELDGRPVTSVWTKTPPISAHSKERLGYPTQKPLALLERIIQASSNEGDVVLDPFCGCGTTVVAAHKLNRRWIGIDVTWVAVQKIEERLIGVFPEGVKDTYVVYGRPHDVASARALAAKSKKEFEVWAISLVGAAPREHDGGVDGLLSIVEGKDRSTKVIVQVKGGEALNPGMVRDLVGTVENEKAAIGLLVTLKEPTSGMKELAVHAGSYTSPVWGKSYPRIQIRTVGELLEGKGFDLPHGESPMKKAAPITERGRAKRML